MTKSLPYLPTKVSMSTRSRISLKPRPRSYSSRMNAVDVVKADEFTLTTQKTSLRPRNNLIQESSINDIINDITDEPWKCFTVIAARKVGVFKNTKVTFAPKKSSKANDLNVIFCGCEDLNPVFDAEALPYLPSCDTPKSNTPPSSAIFRLVPRSSVNSKFLH
jgi:hypothetical protein